MPIPLPMSLQFLLCFGEALLRRGNHSKGTLISLPSDKRTCIIFVSKRTFLATASEALEIEVRIPFFLKEFGIFYDQFTDLS